MFTAFLIAAAIAAPVAPPVVVRAFEPPTTVYGRGHRGVDFRATAFQPVASPIRGVITFVGQVADRPVVTISQGRARVSLEPVLASVGVGDVVDAGTNIGTVGGGGHCSQRCVHVGIRVDGTYIDPLHSRRRLLPY